MDPGSRMRSTTSSLITALRSKEKARPRERLRSTTSIPRPEYTASAAAHPALRLFAALLSTSCMGCISTWADCRSASLSAFISSTTDSAHATGSSCSAASSSA